MSTVICSLCTDLESASLFVAIPSVKNYMTWVQLTQSGFGFRIKYFERSMKLSRSRRILQASINFKWVACLESFSIFFLTATTPVAKYGHVGQPDQVCDASQKEPLQLRETDSRWTTQTVYYRIQLVTNGWTPKYLSLLKIAEILLILIGIITLLIFEKYRHQPKYIKNTMIPNQSSEEGLQKKCMFWEYLSQIKKV